MSDNKNNADEKSDALLLRTAKASGIPKKGLHMTVQLTDGEKEACCDFFDLVEIDDFEARIFLERKSSKSFYLSGTVKAKVVQSCVLTLQPVPTEVDETLDVSILEADSRTHRARGMNEEGELVIEIDEEGLDFYHNDVIDLGALVLEYFSLGLEPYPQAKDAVFQQDGEGKKEPSAFAQLAALKEKMKPS